MCVCGASHGTLAVVYGESVLAPFIYALFWRL